MSDCIDRQTIIDLLTSRAETLRGLYGDLGGAASGVRKLIQTLPSVEPEQKKGEWKPFDLTCGRSFYSCTACGEAMDIPTEMSKPIYSFCPNCGADMRGKHE